MFKTPENLTKDRLKTELKKHGVSFDPHQNKDYYVQLYKKGVQESKGGAHTRSHKGEFSSDEEFIAKRSPRQSLGTARKQQQVNGH